MNAARRKPYRHLFALTALAAVVCSCADDSGDPAEATGSREEAIGRARKRFRAGSNEELRAVLGQLRPGDEIEDDDMSVIVPEPGSGVFVESVYADGTTKTRNIETTPSGVVHLVAEAEGASGTAEPVRAAAPAAEAACSDGRYSLAGHKIVGTYQWSFNPAGTPANLGVENVEAALVRATDTIVNATNDCGLTRKLPLSHKYLGRTTRGAQNTSQGGCPGRGDGTSVTAWGSLPSHLGATACTWYGADRAATESDVLINKNMRFRTSATQAPCANEVGLQTLLTHERGHVFGLHHVSGGRLTMNPVINACQFWAIDLGLGDIRGLDALYAKK
jgi:hypothetical protein